MWSKLFAVLVASTVLFTGSAFAEPGEAECEGSRSRRPAYAFCLARHGNVSACRASLDEPMESWCEAYALGSTTPCSQGGLTDPQEAVCKALSQRSYSKCAAGVKSGAASEEADKEDAAFCWAVVKENRSTCSGAGERRTECQYIVEGLVEAAAFVVEEEEEEEVSTRLRSGATSADQAAPLPAWTPPPGGSVREWRASVPASVRTPEWRLEAATLLRTEVSYEEAFRYHHDGLMGCLTDQYAEEGLEFIDAVDNGEDGDTIVETYVRDGAPKEININFDNRRALVAARDAGTPYDFGPARFEINNLLRNNFNTCSASSERWLEYLVGALR